MARRVDPKPAQTAPAKGAVVELEVLHPERELTLAGRVVTVREYGFMEGLRLAILAKPFQDALYAVIAASDTPPGFEAINQVFETCPDVVRELVAKAADVEPEWIDTLDDNEGYSLFLAWWLANASFFIQRALRRAAEERRAIRSAGPASTQPSSAPDTATPPTTSADTPTAS